MTFAAHVQGALKVLYPPRCLGCGVMVEGDFGLCAVCWRETPFTGGTVCNQCGVPLPGEGAGTCDVCLARPRPWRLGRAALIYEGQARRLVMGLKHADRQEIARPAAAWLLRAARDMDLPQTALVVPVPLHWTRMMRRKYNQSALLAKGVAHAAGLAYAPELLQRRRATRSLEGLGETERAAMLRGAISVNPRQRRRIIGRSVLLIDDVMTSGATLEVATEACLAAGADHVNVLVLARARRPD